jgi:hypothetical protein
LQQEYPGAPSTLQERSVLLLELGEKADLAVALSFLEFLIDLKAAEESVAIARTLDNKWILAYALAWQSCALRLAGVDLPFALAAAAESTHLAGEIRSDWAAARSALSVIAPDNQGRTALIATAYQNNLSVMDLSIPP